MAVVTADVVATHALESMASEDRQNRLGLGEDLHVRIQLDKARSIADPLR